MAVPPKNIVNLFCCIDTKDQTKFHQLSWRFNSNPGGFLSSTKSYTLKDCTFLMLLPKESMKLILPQLLILFTSGVNNTGDAQVLTIMRDQVPTTTQYNFSNTGFILNLIDSFDLTIPNDATYTYFLYKTNVEYEFTSTAAEWSGQIYTWDYRNLKNDPYDIQYLNESTDSQFPYFKTLYAPVLQEGSKKKLANHLILSMSVQEKI